MQNNLIISYLTLRKSIGILGIVLPFVCIIGGLLFGNQHIENSISAYYMTNMRDIMVAVLVAAGTFLISYKGYDQTDDILSTIAGISAICVAFFPMAYVIPGNIFNIQMPFLNTLHYISASLFFIVLSIISFFQFTKHSGKMTRYKKIRNIIYRSSGIIMFVSIIITFLEKITSWDGGYSFVLIMEIIMLIAFGVSWLVKGETFLKDCVSYEENVKVV